jgi:hypothetical protein
VNTQILKRDLDDLISDSTLPLDDPRGICRFDPKQLTALQENPFRQDKTEPVQLVGTVDGCAAGTIMFLGGEIVIDGNVFPVAWCSGLYVIPEYRNSLLGISLIKEARRSCNIVGGSRVGQAALPLFRRLGWLGIPLSRYILPCKSRPVLDYYLGPGKPAAVISAISDRTLFLHRWILKGREKISCSNLRCEPAESMPDSLDPALANLNSPFGCHRSSRWLNWILQNSLVVDPRYKKQLYLVHDRDDRIVAYFVTRVKFQERVSSGGLKDLLAGSVLDWGIFDASTVSEELLWLMATNILTREGVDVVEICEASPKAAMPLGFRKFGHHWLVLYSDPNGPTINEDQIRLWKLRQIDGDSGLF